MEADWSVALTADDPMIVVPWAASDGDPKKCRFLDLRLHPEFIDAVEEARSEPLRAALLRINESASHLWTAKCDVWTGSEHAFDPYEMDAEPGETLFGAGSYIDLLPFDAAVRLSFRQQERWMREVTERLRTLPARAVRAELVLRTAEVEGVPGFGVTWFLEGCGETAQQAVQRWGDALDIALGVLLETPFETAPGDDTMAVTGE
jgi:hypothetical protein